MIFQILIGYPQDIDNVSLHTETYTDQDNDDESKCNLHNNIDQALDAEFSEKMTI